MDQRSAEPVRLVIWDLDETFWKGTLTEGGITFSPEIAMSSLRWPNAGSSARSARRTISSRCVTF
jgi:hypothetical protein